MKNKLPHDWKIVKLGDICELINGDAYKDTDWSNQGVPIIRIQNLNDASKPFNYWAGSVENKIQIDNGDLLLAWSGTPGTSFGAHIWNMGFAILNQHIFKVILDNNIANTIWAKYAINQILTKMIEKSHGAVGLRHITKTETENLEIVLPPLAEQKRIADIIETKLQAVERIKKTANEQLELIDLLFDSYISKTYKGNNFPKDWGWKKLLDLCIEDKVIIDGKNSDLPYLGLEMIESNNSIINWGAKKIEGNGTCFYFDNRHILYSKLRPYLNKVVLPQIKGRCTTELIPLFPTKDTCREFLVYILRRKETIDYAMKEKTGSRMPRANMKHLLNMIVQVPINIDEQKRIADVIETKLQTVEKAKKAVNEQLSFIDALQSSILRQAFKGKL
jgi:type I restriction enzyme S subunit